MYIDKLPRSLKVTLGLSAFKSMEKLKKKIQEHIDFELRREAMGHSLEFNISVSSGQRNSRPMSDNFNMTLSSSKTGQ